MANYLKNIEDLPEFDNHKFVSFFYDGKTGLKGFIAIHNTTLGPAVGGTRYWSYASEKEALKDVLMLSTAMTYKCAIARVPYGGGKGVIIGDPKKPKSKELLKAYADRVDLLNGNFYTGEDVGMNEDDIKILSKESQFIIGRPDKAGDPSPWAALSVFYAIQHSLKFIFGNPKIKGRTFAIKGLGKVGLELCSLLYNKEAKILAADINPLAVKVALRRFPAIKIIKSTEIHKQPVDVYAPCALGNEFNIKTIPQLRCKIICGGANNQLSSLEDGTRLYKRNILYVPDYLANAGGLINVVSELDKRGYHKERVKQKIKEIDKTIRQILKLSRKIKKPLAQIVDQLAQKVFTNKKLK